MLPRCVSILVAFTAALCLLHAPVSAQELDPQRVAQVKARYIELFVQYTQWPTEQFEDEHSDIIITTIGPCDFVEVLSDRIRSAEPIGGRKMRLQRLQLPAIDSSGNYNSDELDAFHRAINRSHLVYFCGMQTSRVRSMLSPLHERNILTVSDIEGFAETGGMINLVLRSGKIKYQANAAEIRKTDLRISSKVLQNAEVVETRRASSS
jgi:hypothetical protein